MRNEIASVTAVLILMVLGGLADAQTDVSGGIDLVSPNGGEAWSVGSSHYVMWKGDGPAAKGTVTAQYTTDGGVDWVAIAAAAPNSGKLLWKVPESVSKKCRVRILTDPPGAKAESESDFSIIPSQEVADYRWVCVNPKAAFAPRDGAGALVFQDKMWLLGGWNPPDKVHFPRKCNNEVWNSIDGRTWSLVKPNTFIGQDFDPESDWEGRHTAGYVVYKDKMWIVGGDPLQGHYQDDVWNSADGKKWIHVNKGRKVPWGPRALHHTVAFKDKIWVMGGQTTPAFAPAETRFYNDVWHTMDGIDWTRIVPQKPSWTARGQIGGNVVFQDKIWLLGGGTYDTPDVPRRQFFNEVWSTSDGAHWQRHGEYAPWHPRQYHEVAAFDDRMWVMEGWNQGNRNDVWYSADGVNWYEVPDTPWKPRHAASTFVYDGGLWMVAGNNFQSDVWKLQRGSAAGK